MNSSNPNGTFKKKIPRPSEKHVKCIADYRRAKCEKIQIRNLNTKFIKAQLEGRESVSRKKLSKEVFIQSNGPGLFENERFIEKCSSIFLRRYRPPWIRMSKYKINRVNESLKCQSSLIDWKKIY